MKIDEFTDLYDTIANARKHGDYKTVKIAKEMLTRIHELFIAPRIVMSSQQRHGYGPIGNPVYDPHSPFGSYDPLPPLKSSDPALQLPVGSIHDHVEHQDYSRECEHEPVEVGFNISKVVCKKCDRVLPKEALYGKKIFQ